MYFSFITPFRKLHLASSALSHGSEMKFPICCIASGLILCKNARRTRYFKSESSGNTCFGSPTYKQINTISVLFPAVQAVTISSSCNCRLQIACFLSPIGNLYAEHKLMYPCTRVPVCPCTHVPLYPFTYALMYPCTHVPMYPWIEILSKFD